MYVYLSIHLYKIFVYFKAFVDSESLSCPYPAALPTLWQYYCTTIAQYTIRPPTPLLCAIHHAKLILAISCKSRSDGRPDNTGGGAYIYIYIYSRYIYIYYMCVYIYVCVYL